MKIKRKIAIAIRRRKGGRLLKKWKI